MTSDPGPRPAAECRPDSQSMISPAGDECPPRPVKSNDPAIQRSEPSSNDANGMPPGGCGASPRAERLPGGVTFGSASGEQAVGCQRPPRRPSLPLTAADAGTPEERRAWARELFQPGDLVKTDDELQPGGRPGVVVGWDVPGEWLVVAWPWGTGRHRPVDLWLDMASTISRGYRVRRSEGGRR